MGRRLAWIGAELHRIDATPASRAVPRLPVDRTPIPATAPVPPVTPPWTAAQRGPSPSARSGVGGRLLPWIGGAVTLLGVLLLLVLAVQRGWLGPLPRVLGGAGLGLALIGVGAAVHRREAGRAGGVVLAATGITALYLDTVAATVLYGYLPTGAGLGVGLLVAAAGLVLADRWRAEALAIAVVVGAAVLALVLTGLDPVPLIGFLLVLQLAATPLQLRRGATVLPIVVAAGGPGRVRAAVAAAGPGTVAGFEATALVLGGAPWAAVLLGEAIVLAGLAAVLGSRAVLGVGAAFGAVGWLTALIYAAPPVAVLTFPEGPFPAGWRADVGELVVMAVVGLLLAGMALAGPWVAHRLGLLRAEARHAALWVPAGFGVLYGVMASTVAVALLVLPDRTGFLIGHVVVTVSWTVAALVLLARGLRSAPIRTAGMGLVGAAVAKLVLFDLSALDGVARVAAFLGTGLVLLAAGTRYARLVAETEPDPD